MLPETQSQIRFEGYLIDRPSWQLRWQDETIALNRKTFDLLLLLIDHRNRVVSKEELLQSLWRDQFVEESNLTQHVFLLRKALSRHASGQKIIETVPGRGYRFTAPLEAEPERGGKRQQIHIVRRMPSRRSPTTGLRTRRSNRFRFQQMSCRSLAGGGVCKGRWLVC